MVLCLKNKILPIMLSVCMILSITSLNVFAESGENDGNNEEIIENFEISESSMFYLPNNMRGTIITPETDFILSEDDDERIVSARLNEVFDKINEYGLNTVIINTATENKIYYNLDMNKSEETDFIELAINIAHDLNLNVFLVYDVNLALRTSSENDAINKLISEVHRFTSKYHVEGIILDDYYNSRSSESYSSYMNNGSGIGYENWLYDSTAYFFETASKIIRMTNNTIPVGTMIKDVWANKSGNEDGSLTEDTVQAYYDGYADTKKYVENGYTDFILVRSYGSLSDPSIPFETVTSWWGDICKTANIPMYIIHHNEKIGTSSTGWGKEDQLLQQLITSEKISSYKGSVFNSYKGLTENPLNTTTTLLKYFADNINEESIFEELVMHSPNKLNFTTYDSYADFMGTFDENFDVYFNDKKIKLNEAGNFYIKQELEIGKNRFTITHKGKTYVYNIERKIVPLKELDVSVKEGQTLYVEGGTGVIITAIAYKGADVSASLGGKTVRLKETSNVPEEYINTSYATFVGKYIVPEGIIEKEQNLGQMTVKATYQGYSGSLLGANIIVNALPKPPPVDITGQMFDQSSIGSGEVVGVIDAVKGTDEETRLVRVLNDYTTVYDSKMTGKTYNPEFSQLPAGTTDYYRGKSGDYINTTSGKRFSSGEVSVVDGYGFGTNKLHVRETGTSNGDSYFKIQLDTKISYNIKTSGNSFFTSWGTDYNISSYSPEYVYIDFDNVTSVTKIPDLSTNLVFDSGVWEQITVSGIPKFRLVLHLRQTGVYGGNGAFYNDNGELVLTFEVLTNSLAGMNIVIDPGHGYGKNSSTFDPGAIGHVVEQEVVLEISKKVASRLRNAGANVTMLNTHEKLYVTEQRPIIARQYNCDLFLSIHANRAEGDDVRGTEVYYYTPFSMPLAKSISSAISSYMSSNVYADGADKNRGAKYSYYWVTLQQDFPSVLIETGFVSNYEDAMALGNSDNQDGIAAGIVSGIKNYLGRSSLSYSYDGNVSIDASGETPETPTDPAETTEPENQDDPAEETDETEPIGAENDPPDEIEEGEELTPDDFDTSSDDDELDEDSDTY